MLDSRGATHMIYRMRWLGGFSVVRERRLELTLITVGSLEERRQALKKALGIVVNTLPEAQAGDSHGGIKPGHRGHLT